MFSFVHGVRGFYESMADFEVLFKYNKIENEVKEKSDAKAFKIKKGKIEFKNIDFSYNKNNKRQIFKNFNLKIPSNKMIALVGHSGCGKSTLVKLLYRLYDVQKGSILIDGIDIRDFKKEALRSEMSIVPQDCALFDDTILNNIAFSKPNATKAEVIQAAKKAQLDNIIKHFPEGYKTIVGERGVKLSGGEKQRVSIARAILANKKILVLDEATSALDSKTEHDIQKALTNLMKNRTSVVIAHRLSTIMKADLIVVMNKGKVVEMATHKELVSKKGHYNKLWDLQKGSFEEEKNDKQKVKK
jgi:ABC-type multidrug transport system fused ATPase/permease subunit